MELINSYVLEIPDFGYMLKQEDVERFELFLLIANDGYRKIAWNALPLNDSYVFIGKHISYSPLKAVRLDFKNNCIVFYRGQVNEQEFEDFIYYFIDSLFLHINPDQLHFLVLPAFLRIEK